LSKILGNKLPADLLERLAGKNLQAVAEKAIMVCSVDSNSWPHPAILSYFEVIAKDESNVRLAIYKDSATVANLLRNGKLTMQIVDQRIAYYVKGSVRELAHGMKSSPPNAKLNLRVEQVLADTADEEFEPGAYVTGGVTYTRPAKPANAWEVLKELLA